VEPAAVEQRPRPVTGNARAFRVLVRNAMFRRVELVALRRPDLLSELDPDVDWIAALEAYSADHASAGTGPDARGPQFFQVDAGTDRWDVRQVIDDPADDHDWALVAEVDLRASDEQGTAALHVTGLTRLDS